MPLRMAFANPIALAALTVIAIGVITYQILTRQRGRIRYRDDDNDDPPGPDDLPGPDNPKSIKPNNYSLFLRRRTVVTQSPVPDDPLRPDNPKSIKPDNDYSRRTVATQSPDDASDPPKVHVEYKSQDHPNSSSNSFAEQSELSQLSGYTDEQNNEVQKVDGSTNQLNSKMLDFVANITDEDSDSSESNNSLNSVGNENRGVALNECICGEKSSSATGIKNFRAPKPLDSKEEIYKREVCNYLKSKIENENYKEKYFKSLNDDDDDDDESDESENNLSISSADSSTSTANAKKLKMCNGCLENFANAVAYPCTHCYLCLDCAIKVHRIYKKCTVCHSVIKTFEQLKM